MGDVVSLTEYMQRNPQKEQKVKEYEGLRQLEKAVFGDNTEGQSFLEAIAQEAENMPIRGQPRVLKEVSERMGKDLYYSGYLNFEKFDTGKYQSLLHAALVYTYTFEADQGKADRICAVATHLYRFQTGLPSLFRPESINRYRKTIRGRISYWLKERRVRKELIGLQLDALHRAHEKGATFDTKKQTTSSSPVCSSGSSSPTAS